MATAVQIRPQLHLRRPQLFLQPAPETTIHRLSPITSSLLDLIRLTAALLVVVSHLGHPEFRTNFPDLSVLGAIAVPIFFVLSGFIIRYITLARPHTLRRYLIDRAARIYSIALPAMAVTLLITALISHINPLYFQQEFAATCDHPIARLLLNLTFLSQSWSHNTIPFVDSPFWSLSYEVLFYIAYGFAFYLRGLTRILTLGLWTLVAGPQVLFLLPLWLFGAFVYDLHLKLRNLPRAANFVRVLSCYLALACVIGAIANRAQLAVLPAAISALPTPLTLLHIPSMRATPFAFAVGTCAAFALLLTLLLADLVQLPRKSPIQPWLARFRRIADGTFAIYLMHYPVMVLAAATGFMRQDDLALNLATTAIICLVLIAVAAPLDRFKLLIRSTLIAFLSPSYRPPSRTMGPARNWPLPIPSPIFLLLRLPASVTHSAAPNHAAASENPAKSPSPAPAESTQQLPRPAHRALSQ